MQYAHTKSIHICFQVRFAFIWWEKLCLCVYVVGSQEETGRKAKTNLN